MYQTFPPLFSKLPPPPISDDEILDDAERIATIEDVFNQTLNQWGSGTLIQAELSPRRPEFVLQ